MSNENFENQLKQLGYDYYLGGQKDDELYADLAGELYYLGQVDDNTNIKQVQAVFDTLFELIRLAEQLNVSQTLGRFGFELISLGYFSLTIRGGFVNINGTLVVKPNAVEIDFKDLGINNCSTKNNNLYDLISQGIANYQN